MSTRHLFATAALAVPLALVTTAMMAQGSYPTPTGEATGKTEQAPGSSVAPAAGMEKQMGQTAPAAAEFIGRQEQTQTLASSLIGREVVNGQGESLGEVSDLLLDGKGELTALIVEVGGFLGIGGKKIGVSLPQLTERAGDDGEPVMVLAVSTDELEQLAEFKSVRDMEREREAARRAAERTREAPNRALRPGGVPAR